MTCYDCINYDDCIKRGDVAAINLTEDSEKECDLFKNKADFVEVVRCKDCDVLHNKWTGCPHLNGLIPPPNHYCALGERRDT
jgi:hypothetical protein